MKTPEWMWLAAAALAFSVPTTIAAQDEYASPILANIPQLSRLFHNPVREFRAEKPAVERVEIRTPLLSDIPYVGRLFTNVALVETNVDQALQSTSAADAYTNTGTPVIACENGSCGMARMAALPAAAPRVNVVAAGVPAVAADGVAYPVYSAATSIGPPLPTYSPAEATPVTPVVSPGAYEPTLQISLQEYTKLIAAVAKAEAREELRAEYDAKAATWKIERDALLGEYAEAQNSAIEAVMEGKQTALQQQLAALTKQLEAEAAKVAAEQTRLKELEEVLKQQIEDNAGLRAKVEALTKEHTSAPTTAGIEPTVQPSLNQPVGKPATPITTY